MRGRNLSAASSAGMTWGNTFAPSFESFWPVGVKSRVWGSAPSLNIVCVILLTRIELRSSTRSALIKAACLLLLGGACFFLYYGTVMLFFVPGKPGEYYWAPQRFIYGLLPVFVSAILFIASYGLGLRSNATDGHRRRSPTTLPLIEE